MVTVIRYICIMSIGRTFLLAFVVFLYSSINAQDLDNLGSIIIDENILNRPLEYFEDDFKEVPLDIAQKKLATSNYKIMYKGVAPLRFLNHEVTSLGLYKKRNSKVVNRFRFEIPYENDKIFYDLLEYFGDPYRVIPKDYKILGVHGDIEFYKSYGLENCVEFYWDSDSDYFVTLMNLPDY